ncbi:unnamed protein product [Boreogadus saida]
MATEGGDKAETKKKLTGPARILRLGMTRKGSGSRANRRQASEGGDGEGGGVSGTQEEVREEAEVCSGVDVPTTRGSCSQKEEVKGEAGRGTRKTQKGVWRRVFFTCLRRRRRPRPEGSTPGCPGEQMGPSSEGARRKRRFPGLTLLRRLLPSSRGRDGGAGPRCAAEDARGTRPPLHGSPGAAGRPGSTQEGTDCGRDNPQRVALENNNDRDVPWLSEAVLDEARHALKHRSDLDDVAMEMSVQEPEAATESQLGCFEPASEVDPQRPDPRAPEQRLTDGSPDPAENHLPPPAAAHNDLSSNTAVATADQLPDDKASPSGGTSEEEEEEEEEEEAMTPALFNGLHRVGDGVAMATEDPPAARAPPSPWNAVLVVPLIRLNSGEEDGVACDWGGGAGVWETPAPEDESPLEVGVEVESDWEEVKGGGGGGDADGLVLAAQAVVQAALLAAVQQLLREQQNSVDHAHHHDAHHLSPAPY